MTSNRIISADQIFRKSRPRKGKQTKSFLADWIRQRSRDLTSGTPGRRNKIKAFSAGTEVVVLKVRIHRAMAQIGPFFNQDLSLRTFLYYCK